MRIILFCKLTILPPSSCCDIKTLISPLCLPFKIPPWVPSLSLAECCSAHFIHSFLVSSSTLTVSICWGFWDQTSSPILSKHPTYLFYWTLLTGSHTSIWNIMHPRLNPSPPETLTDTTILSLNCLSWKPRRHSRIPPRSYIWLPSLTYFISLYTSKIIPIFLTAGPGLCHPWLNCKSVPCRFQPPWLPWY